MEQIVPRDNGGRRFGLDRREFSYSTYIPERRNKDDRRCDLDRRKGLDRRKTFPMWVVMRERVAEQALEASR